MSSQPDDDQAAEFAEVIDELRVLYAEAEQRATWVDAPSITCPRCGRTSYNPTDIREGYCGACRDWTSEREAQ